MVFSGALGSSADSVVFVWSSGPLESVLCGIPDDSSGLTEVRCMFKRNKRKGKKEMEKEKEGRMQS